MEAGSYTPQTDEESPKIALLSKISGIAGPCWVGMFSGASSAAAKPKSNSDSPSSAVYAEAVSREMSDSSPDRPHQREVVLRDNSRLKAELTNLRSQARALGAEEPELRGLRNSDGKLDGNDSKFRAVLKENGLLKAEIKQVREQLRAAQSALENNSEGRLRSVLLRQTSTAEELRNAIAGVQQVLDQAKRELRAKEIREERKAYEDLHNATEKGDEDLLIEAIANFRRCGLSGEELEKAEAKLKGLQSLTEEERAARDTKAALNMKKKEAYVLVKQNNGVALQELLDSLDTGVRWQEWHDISGRTLWRYARDLNQDKAKAVLASKLGYAQQPWREAPGREAPASPSAQERRTERASGSTSPAVEDAQRVQQPNGTQQSDVEAHRARSEAIRGPRITLLPLDVPIEQFDSPRADDSQGGSEMLSPASGPSPDRASVFSPRSPRSQEEISQQDRLKARALGAVARKDAAALEEILEQTTTDVVKSWQNRAGTDLLTLSIERNSGECYSVLAKALGIVTEMPREEFEEKCTVWVFLMNDLQPKQATVLEDTPPENDYVLVEFWEGTAPAEKVPRSRIRRMWS